MQPRRRGPVAATARCRSSGPFGPAATLQLLLMAAAVSATSTFATATATSVSTSSSYYGSSTVTAAPTANNIDDSDDATSISITATAIVEIVQEAESCIYLCYDAACIDKGCSAGDFDCVCGNPNSLVVELGICAGKYCDGSDSIDSGNWLAEICDAYSASPASTEIATASAILMSEIAEASATATNNPIPSDSVSVSSANTVSNSTSSSVSLHARTPSLFSLLTAALVGGSIAAVALLL